MYSNNLICNILNYIDINLNTKISIDDLENKFYYNRYYIMKLFKKEIGITIFNYINKLRVLNSISQISNTTNNLIKIAMNNGFYSIEYFSEIFKKEVSVSPSKYKKMLLEHTIYHNYEVINNIIELNKLKEKKNKYLNNAKPIVAPVKKLSIFS